MGNVKEKTRYLEETRRVKNYIKKSVINVITLNTVIQKIIETEDNSIKHLP